MLNYCFRLTLLQDSCDGTSEIIGHSKHDATTLYKISFDTLSSHRNKLQMNDIYLNSPLWNIAFVQTGSNGRFQLIFFYMMIVKVVNCATCDHSTTHLYYADSTNECLDLDEENTLIDTLVKDSVLYPSLFLKSDELLFLSSNVQKLRIFSQSWRVLAITYKYCILFSLYFFYFR